MIVVMLQAGFANQMFQYAAGRHLAKLRDTDLQLDTRWYDAASQDDGVGRRHYELDNLMIQATIFKPTLLNRGRFKLLGRGVYSDEDEPYVFHSEVLDLPNYSRLFGFFQNRRYFEPIRGKLLSEFSPKTEAKAKNKALLTAIAADPMSVAIHVRRGDYVTSPVHRKSHGSLSDENTAYYRRAIDLVKKSIKKPSLYVFSDDIEWCKQNLKFDLPTVYVDNDNPGYEDMRLMRSCKHNIIANSSFSWWAAWLNENPHKIVVAPTNWINANFDTSDLLPPGWSKL